MNVPDVSRSITRALLIFASLAPSPLITTQAWAAAESVDASGRRQIAFEPNVGQSENRVRFVARGASYRLQLTERDAILALRASVPPPPLPARLAATDGGSAAMRHRIEEARSASAIRIEFEAARAKRIVGEEMLASWSNYVIGNDPAGWQTCVPHYSRVRYEQIYPGIDLVFYGRDGEIEYDFVASPGADLSAIRLAIGGASRMRIDRNGDLILLEDAGSVRMRRPDVYQLAGGIRSPVEARYVIGPAGQGERTISFDLGSYDPTRALIIDPVIAYSTYLGGGQSPYGNVYGWDLGLGITLDSSGNAYITGDTWSIDYPMAGAMQSANAGQWDVLVSKLSANGASLLYSTYIGGTGDDEASGIAVDTAGNIYIAGVTSSTDFPVSNAFQATNAGGSDAFVLKINASGTALLYSSYFGGAGADIGMSLALLGDGSNTVYATGLTASTDFPTVSPYQAASGGGANDAFLLKCDPALTGAASLLYSTYFGGTGDDRSVSVALDGSDRAYISGSTSSTDLPTAGPIQSNNNGGAFDAFITGFNAAGSALRFSTYLGGAGEDRGTGLDIDSSGRVYIAGRTVSGDFPTTAGALDTSCGSDGTCDNGVMDAFVARLSSSGSTLMYSTYLGGSGDDRAVAVDTDSQGRAYISGSTGSTDFPQVNSVQAAFGGGDTDAFVARLNTSGSALSYSTWLGGSASYPGWYDIPSEDGQAIVVDADNSAFVTGYTWSPDFPTQNAYQPAKAGDWDVFVTKLSDPLSADMSIAISDSPDPIVAGNVLTYSITLTNNGPDGATNVSVTDALPSNVQFVSADSTQGSCTGSTTVTCDLGGVANGATAGVTIRVRPASAGSVSNTASVTATEADPTASNNTVTSSTTVTQVRGDSNGDGTVTASDAFFLINYLFAGGTAPATTCGGDANNDGSVAVSDVFFLINHLFAGGPAPAGC